MILKKLISNIEKKKTFLCVGLDSDITKIPIHLAKYDNPILEFNKQIIEATLPYCIAYKINTAFYESQGWSGWKTMAETRALIPDTHLCIADAKRADIGNTSAQYAKAFFETMNFDAITVSPYMGIDCIEPFLAYKNKFTIVLALTSNKGSIDFELNDSGGRLLYEQVLERFSETASPEKLMFVVGATQGERLTSIRKIVPEHFLLVPGVGAQGGDLETVIRCGKNNNGGLLINASRSIIYASPKENFTERAAEEAKKLSEEMSIWF